TYLTGTGSAAPPQCGSDAHSSVRKGSPRQRQAGRATPPPGSAGPRGLHAVRGGLDACERGGVDGETRGEPRPTELFRPERRNDSGAAACARIASIPPSTPITSS